nr:glycine/betaine ABC transporter substrate-binding protein [Rubrobacter sp.]
EATVCIESEFRSRDDGLPGMAKAYGYEFPQENISLFDVGVVYDRTDKGEPCNFGEVFTTDGRIAGLGLVPLEDDKSFFPIYNPALEVKKSTYKQYGKQLDKIFTPIAKALDTNTMQKLNAQADVEGIPYEDVAQQWLEKEGFVG